MTEFTATEFRRRVRALIAEARSLSYDLRSAVKVEIGTRTIPVYTPTVPTHDEAWPEEDDLRDFSSMGYDVETLRRDGLLRPGMVVHLYFSTTGMSGELVNVVTGWTGHAPTGLGHRRADSIEPVLLDVPGRVLDPSPYAPEPGSCVDGSCDHSPYDPECSDPDYEVRPCGCKIHVDDDQAEHEATDHIPDEDEDEVLR